MTYQFKLPDIGEGVHEGEIVQWLAQTGQFIREDQPLVEVMTDKVTAEIPAPLSGHLLKTVGNPGDVIPVGSVIAVFEPSETVHTSSPTPVEPKENRSIDTLPLSTNNRHQVCSPAIQKESGQKSSRADAILAAPATRRLARSLAVDISTIQGSGPKGRITPEDVKAVATKGLSDNNGTEVEPSGIADASTSTLSAQVNRKEYPVTSVKTVAPVVPLEQCSHLDIDQARRVPYVGIRRKIGDHLVHSKKTAPHFAYMEEVDMTELVKLKETLLPVAEEKTVRLSYLPFIMKAVFSGLQAYPSLNATLDEGAQEIVYQHLYNMGVAVSTDQGLLVPVIQNVDQKGLLQLATEVESVAQLARSHQLSVEHMHGGTFTLTSIGSIGGLLSVPIINYPEVAILGINKISKRPVVKEVNGEDTIVIRQMMNLSISCDHRVVDGAEAALFLKHVIRYLETPELLLLAGEL